VKSEFFRSLLWVPHAFRVVLEIDQAVAVVELQLQPPEHFKTQETRNLGAGKSAHGGEVEGDDT